LAHVPRQFPRLAVEAEVRVVDGDQLLASGTTTNLSMGGLCAHVDQMVEGGAEVELAITLVFSADSFSEALTLAARVVWATALGDKVQLGCSFLQLSAEDRRYLEIFLRYLQPE
jgi:Tfp pilus assembly protein PilZ